MNNVEYPEKHDFTVKMEARFSKQEDGGCIVHIPAIDAYFSAKSDEDRERKCQAMVQSFIRFWNEGNSGVFNK